MSTLAQQSVAIPPGASAVQVASLGSTDGKLGPVTLHITMMAATDFYGKPKAVDSGIFTFQESADGGANWTTLGSSTTVAGMKTITLLPSQKLFRVLGRTTLGKGGTAKLDAHFTGRFGGGQLEWRTYGGKEGYSYSGDPSTDPTAAELGLGSANPAGTWPVAFPPAN